MKTIKIHEPISKLIFIYIGTYLSSLYLTVWVPAQDAIVFTTAK